MPMKANQQHSFGLCCFFPETVLEVKKLFVTIDQLYNLLFVEFWVMIKIMLYCMDTGSLFLVLKQTDCTFRFNKYCSEKSCILRVRLKNARQCDSRTYLQLWGVHLSCTKTQLGFQSDLLIDSLMLYHWAIPLPLYLNNNKVI